MEAVLKNKVATAELSPFFKACLNNVEVGIENLKGKRISISIKAETANAMVDKFKENPAFTKFSWEAVKLALKPFLQAEIAKAIATNLGVVETE